MEETKETQKVVALKYCYTEKEANEFLTSFANGQDIINITCFPAPAVDVNETTEKINSNVWAVIQYWANK